MELTFSEVYYRCYYSGVFYPVLRELVCAISGYGYVGGSFVFSRWMEDDGMRPTLSFMLNMWVVVILVGVFVVGWIWCISYVRDIKNMCAKRVPNKEEKKDKDDEMTKDE